VEKAYALGQHSSSPVLNRPSEFFECLTIPISVYCGRICDISTLRVNGLQQLAVLCVCWC
jgi:hypothetical protein